MPEKFDPKIRKSSASRPSRHHVHTPSSHYSDESQSYFPAYGDARYSGDSDDDMPISGRFCHVRRCWRLIISKGLTTHPSNHEINYQKPSTTTRHRFQAHGEPRHRRFCQHCRSIHNRLPNNLATSSHSHCSKIRIDEIKYLRQLNCWVSITQVRLVEHAGQSVSVLPCY